MQRIKNMLTKLSSLMPKRLSIQKTLGVFVLFMLVLGLAPRALEVSHAASCSVILQPTFNPFPVSFAAQAPDCFDYPQITAQNITQNTGYPTSQAQFDNGIDAQGGDKLYVLMYIHNGAAQNTNPPLVAHNVQVTTDFGSAQRTRHQITTTFTGSNVVNSGLSSRIAINTPNNEAIEAVPNSGELFDSNANPLATGLNFANTTYTIGDQFPCFEFAMFLRFKVRVVPNQAANGSLSVIKDVNNTTKATGFTDPVSAVNNDNLTYRIRVQNTSTTPLTNVTVTDNIGLLTGLTPARNISAGNHTFSGDLANGMNVGTVQPNETVTITYDTSVNSTLTFPLTLTNTAVARADNASSAQDQAVVTVQPAQQNGALSLTKQVKNTTQGGNFASTAQANQNDTVSYKLTITNNSNVVLNNIRTSDNVFNQNGLSNIRNVQVSRGFAGSLDSQIQFNTLQPGVSETITYDATVATTGPATITNTATSIADNANQITASATVTVQQLVGNLTITKLVRDVTTNGSFASLASANQNDAVEYQVRVTNNGQGSVQNVTLRDQLNSSGITIDQNSITPFFSGSLSSGLSLGTMTAGQTITVTYRGTVTIPGPATVVNTATVQATGVSPKTASATVNVIQTFGQLAITKQVRNVTKNGTFAASAQASQNDMVEYQVRVTNNGQGSVQGVTLRDQLNNSGITIDQNSITPFFSGSLSSGLNLGTMTAGQTITVTYRGTVTTAGPSTINNTATAQGTNVNSVSASASVTVQQSVAALSIVKQVRNANGGSYALSATAHTGDTVQYQVRVTNTSQTTANNVTLRDQFNASGITIDQNSITPFFSGSLSSGLSIGALTAGQSVTVFYNGLVGSTASGTIGNTATTQATNASPASASASVTVIQDPPAQLTITKQVRNVTTNGSFAASAQASQNNTVEYRVTVTNVGSTAANSVTLRDQLNNSGITIDQNSITPFFSGSLSGGLSLNTLQPNQPVTVMYRGTVNVNGPITINNTATASAPSVSSVSASASVNVNQVNTQTNLSINKQVSNITRGTGFADSTSAQSGDLADYRVQIQNIGTTTATGLILTDVLPNGVTLQGTPTVTSGFSVSGTLSNGLSISGNLAPGQIVTVTYRVTVNQNNGSIINTATARANNADPVSDNATIIIQGGSVSLTIIKDVQNLSQNTGYADTTNAASGNLVQYRITVRNTGNGAAQNVRVTDTATNLSQLSVNTNSLTVSRGSTGNLSNGIVLSNDLEANGVFTITYIATVNSGSGTVTNTATVSANNVNSLTDTAQVFLSNSQTQLSLQKTVRNITNNSSNGFVKNVDARTNDQLEFRLEVTNFSSSPANQVTLSDVVPSGLNFISGSVTSSNGNGNDSLNTTGGLNLGTINQNQTVTVYFRAQVNQNFNGSITNIARASANNADPVTSNAVVNISQTSNGTLSITKMVRSLDFNTGFSRFLTVQNGERVEYQIRVTAQNGRVDNVQLFESFPSGQINLLGGSGRLNGNFIDDGFINRSISLGSLENGQTAVLTFQGTAQSFGNNSSITNTATASGNNVGQVSDTATLSVNQINNGQLIVTKSVRTISGNVSYQNSVNANNGDRVSFEIVVRNSGSGTINNVHVTDSIPSGLTLDTNSVRLDGAVVNGNSFLDVFVGSLFGGQQRRITFEATVNNNFGNNSSIQNIARATGDNTSQVQDDAFVILNSNTLASNMLFSKRAFNDTRNADATTVNAQREDFITYTLSATNNGSGTATSFVITDDLSGVLPFADMVDNGGGYVTGNTITFPGVDIAPGATVSKTFKVRVKFSLDASQTYQMNNTYGNNVRITIAGTGVFIAPKTGSSAASAITFSGLLTSAFMVLRRRKEIMSLVFA